MNILIFNWRDPRHGWAGGGEIYTFEQAKRWVKMGHSVTVFCGQDFDNKLQDFEVWNGINIYRKGGRYSLYFWAAWYYLSRFRRKFDLVIDVENGIPFFTPLFSLKPKVCLVYHVHGTQFFYEIPAPLNYVGFVIEKYIFPLLYKRVPIIAISQTTKKQLIRNGFDKNNITVIYCGIDGSQNKIKYPVKRYVRPTLLYLGRIKKYKRVDLLVKIFPEIVKKIPNVRLIVAGWGTEASNVTDLVMRNPFRRKISLMGPVSNAEKRELLSKSWVFVNPSIGEGWSIAVVEANLFRTPAVAFDVPGLSESIEEGKTGLLAENEEEIVEKISTLLRQKKYCETLGKNAQMRAFGFDWDATASQSLKLLQKIADQKNKN